MMTVLTDPDIPNELKDCVRFHGHLCPGLVYGYRVAIEALKHLGISRAPDEEIIAISENDSCAVDGIQKILGTTSGKGNLIIRNYGKNVYTVQSRNTQKAVRFSRILGYCYEGDHPEEFEILEKKVATKSATKSEMKRQKLLKAMDLALKNFDRIFTRTDVDYEEIDYAPLAPSVACATCGELTMKTRMIEGKDKTLRCIPCDRKVSMIP
ncbi:MAG: formylmethanofuran dehydrogenase [Proteobacteria bacterium]|nr:formylmethanofuran dehydrogenase [Pseudomonadota bacterium]